MPLMLLRQLEFFSRSKIFYKDVTHFVERYVFYLKNVIGISLKVSVNFLISVYLNLAKTVNS